jgi:hypothetical protein
VRVHELAKALGVPARELLGFWADKGGPSSASANVDEQSEALARERFPAVPTQAAGSAEQPPSPIGQPAGTAPSDDPEQDAQDQAELLRLIRMAFESRRDAGKTDWDRMSVAVLKNKVLDLTDRHFDQAQWGASTFTGLLRTVPIIALDESQRPPVAVLAREAAAAERSAGARTRLRPDLWRAVMDYSAGVPYVLRNGEAVRQDAPPTEPAPGPEPVLPTATREELAQWRQDFASAHAAAAAAADQEQLAAWRERGLGTRMLPAGLQGPWNDDLQRRALDRLRSWFDEQGLPVPSDILQEAQTQPPPTAPLAPPRRSVQDYALRGLVLRVVRAMTRQELEELRLPPAALLRGETLGRSQQ